jgi:hypothetical protein
MKIRIFKYAILVFVLGVSTSNIGFTNALFSDQEIISGNEISTGCWAAPTTPEHVYPLDETVAGTGSVWLGNPYMDWSDSETTCPMNDVVMKYQYQSYHDEALTSLAYSSGLLGSSMIPAPGTPDGTYYWRVRSFDGHTYSPWSGAWLLTVDRSIVPVATGDVVINEIMWMGSSVGFRDEWLELRNMTDKDINIGQWTIENAKSSNGTYQIPGNKTIPAHGFFLITNYPEPSANTALSVSPDVHSAGFSFSNSGNGNLVLKNVGGGMIDTAKGDSWPEGVNGDPDSRSMERNSTPGDGTSAGSWHTCIAAGCNDTTFWDVNGDDYGTPGATNLSENDPTSAVGEEEGDDVEEEGKENDDAGGTGGDNGNDDASGISGDGEADVEGDEVDTSEVDVEGDEEETDVDTGEEEDGVSEGDGEEEGDTGEGDGEGDVKLEEEAEVDTGKEDEGDTGDGGEEGDTEEGEEGDTGEEESASDE